MDSAGDQLFLSMSMQTFPFSEIFMWYILQSNPMRDETTWNNGSCEPGLEQNFRGGKPVTSQGFSRERKVGKMYARIIIAELNLDVEHSTLVDATFWPRDACPPEKWIVTRDGSDGNVTQILFLEVRYFAMNAL